MRLHAMDLLKVSSVSAASSAASVSAAAAGVAAAAGALHPLPSQRTTPRRHICTSYQPSEGRTRSSSRSSRGGRTCLRAGTRLLPCRAPSSVLSISLHSAFPALIPCASAASSVSASTAESSAAATAGVTAAAAGAAALAGDSVEAQVEVLGANSRRVSASLAVAVPLEALWAVLTDYQRLAEFIPSLAKNEVLERRGNGARLLQVGEQDVALGLKFQARVVVDVEEGPEDAVSEAAAVAVATASVLDKGGVQQPQQQQHQQQAEVEGGRLYRRRWIGFTMLEGDFVSFKGRWTLLETPLQQSQAGGGTAGAGGTLVSYGVDVTPHFWLPVGLVESRISRDISRNLFAVAQEAFRRLGAADSASGGSSNSGYGSGSGSSTDGW